MMVLLFRTTTLLARLAPKKTFEPDAKPMPEIVMLVPPVLGPLLGSTVLMVGLAPVRLVRVVRVVGLT